MVGQLQTAWMAQRNMSGTERGQKSQLSQLARAGERFPCQWRSLGQRYPAGRWHWVGDRSILWSGELEDFITGLQRGSCRQKVPVWLQGSPWLS